MAHPEQYAEQPSVRAEDNYVPHTWQAYPMNLRSPDQPPTQPTEVPYVVCTMGSPLAESTLERDGDPSQLRFYYDYEQLAAGLDRTYGVNALQELAEEWRGNPAGALALQVFSGTKEDPTATIWMIEQAQQAAQ